MHNGATVTMASSAHSLEFNESATSIFELDAKHMNVFSVEGSLMLYMTILSQVLAVYYGIAMLMHYILPLLFSVVSVQGSKSQNSDETRRDAGRSVVPLMIKAFTLVVAEMLHRAGWGVMRNVSLLAEITSAAGALRLLTLVALLDFYHDTWFYFVHRLLHRPWFMKHVHWMHHQSTVPSAFTGYSFHWIEAWMVFTNAIVEIFLFPIPFAFYRVYELWMIAIHVGGHCGYEMAPFIPHLGQSLWWLTGGGKNTALLLNTVDHHDIHHKHPKFHFSLYFTHWDYWLGTMHHDYVRRHKPE